MTRAFRGFCWAYNGDQILYSQDKGGDVKVTIVKSLPSYKGSARNGVTTSDWANSWGDTAFQVSK